VSEGFKLQPDSDTGGCSTQTAAEALRVNLPTIFPVQPQPEPDSELVAQGKCVEALKGLDLDQCNRLVNGLLHRFVTVPISKRAQQEEEQKLLRLEQHEERMKHLRLVQKQPERDN
jgi:hypothetical protein